MDDEVELLLAGPRGRRLCLQLAADSDPELASGLHGLAHEMDPGKGASRVYLAFIYSSGEPAEQQVPPVPTLDEFVAQLRRINPPAITADGLQAALAASVDSARYWQPSDGEDVLAAEPEVREALRPIARAIMASPEVEWWRHPMPGEQWMIDWRSADDTGALPRSSPQGLARWAESTRNGEARAAVERPADPHAAYSGDWWSFPVGTASTAGRIPAAFDLVEDSLGWEDARVIPARGAGRVLEIRDAHDWVDLCREHPLEVTASRRHDWFRVTGRDGRWVIPDWERVAVDWSAVHLTVLAYLSAATRALDVDDETATVIAGWSPDTTIWLQDAVRAVGAPQAWVQDVQSRAWSRCAPPSRAD